jgi:hypothetical protein
MEELGYNSRFYREGVSIMPAHFLKQQRMPGPEEEKIQLPEWAAERAREISRNIVDGIESSGVRVIGNLKDLTRASASNGAQQVNIPAELAAHLAVGMLVKSGLARKKSESRLISSRSTLMRAAERISASSKLGELVVRASTRILRRLI